jgi:hypothetical protein
VDGEGVTEEGEGGTPPSKEHEIAILEEYARILESELDSIKKRLEEIKT